MESVLAELKCIPEMCVACNIGHIICVLNVFFMLTSWVSVLLQKDSI